MIYYADNHEEVVIQVIGHTIVSLALAGLIYYFFHSLAASAACIISGVFIDADHFIDYWLHRGFNFDIKGLFRWSENMEWRFLVLIGHSIEFVLILWLVVLYFHLGPVWIGLVTGYSGHLVLDMLFNRGVYVYTYFLTYRLRHGLRRQYLRRQE